MPSYIYSDLNIDISNLEVLLEAPAWPKVAFAYSNLNIDISNAEVLLRASPILLEAVLFSSFIIDKSNVEVLSQAPVLFAWPPQAEIRQIYSDSDKIYAATSRGLVIFSL
jgi:hypothetical protein